MILSTICIVLNISLCLVLLLVLMIQLNHQVADKMQTVKWLAHILWCSTSKPILKCFVKKIYSLPIGVKMSYPSRTFFVSSSLTSISILPPVSSEESEENYSYWFMLGLLRIWDKVQQFLGSFQTRLITRGIINTGLKLCTLRYLRNHYFFLFPTLSTDF